jgi:hypothetical protein
MTIQAQDAYAAVITIHEPGIEILRVDTEAWIALPQGAIAVIGTGDHVRADARGRALIRFLDRFEVLLMPTSTLTIDQFRRTDQTDVEVELTLDGHLIQRTHDADHMAYRLHFGTAEAIHPSDHFAVWSDFEGTPVLTSAIGMATLTYDDQRWEVEAERAFFTLPEARVVTLAAPYHAATLIGDLLSCPGTINAIGENSLNVRSGTGTGFTIIGYYGNGEQVKIVGINETGSWYRIQRFTGFGWVQVLGVETTCTDLPAFPRLFGESNSEIFNVLPEELDLMIPFYDTPRENLWFYRGVVSDR